MKAWGEFKYQVCRTISMFLLYYLNLSIFFISEAVTVEYEISSHYNLWSSSKIYETISVDISFATKLSLFNLVQFLQILKIPYLVTPVPPMNNYYIYFKVRAIEFTPLFLIGFLKIWNDLLWNM
jgi:hypothetical protein